MLSDYAIRGQAGNDASWPDDLEVASLTLLDGLPPDLRQFVPVILDCPAGIRLLCLFAQSPFTSRTLSDLAYWTHEAEERVKRALTILVEQGIIREMVAAGVTFYGLADDPGTLARVSAFCTWRGQWLSRIRSVQAFLDAEDRLGPVGASG